MEERGGREKGRRKNEEGEVKEELMLSEKGKQVIHTNKDFSSRVVHPNIFEDGSSVICHLDTSIMWTL